MSHAQNNTNIVHLCLNWIYSQRLQTLWTILTSTNSQMKNPYLSESAICFEVSPVPHTGTPDGAAHGEPVKS